MKWDQVGQVGHGISTALVSAKTKQDAPTDKQYTESKIKQLNKLVLPQN